MHYKQEQNTRNKALTKTDKKVEYRGEGILNFT